jgi:dTDP-glucose 4,6-dehydratase
VTVFDALTYAGNLENLAELRQNPRFKFVQGDIRDAERVDEMAGESDIIVNFAAETDVDRSIVVEDEREFFGVNYEGAETLFGAARRNRVELLVHISTHEVYGPRGPNDPDTPETAKLKPTPSNLYAVSKMLADKSLRHKQRWYRVPVIVARPSNTYGPYQYPEKLVPLLITNAIQGLPLPIYGDGRNVREWVFVDDLCRALDLLLEKGVAGEVYNIGGGSANRRENRDVAELVARAFEKPQVQIRNIGDRPQHDQSYALDSSKIRGLGWEPRFKFEDGLAETIGWYTSHEDWWRPLKERFAFSEFARKIYPPEVLGLNSAPK